MLTEENRFHMNDFAITTTITRGELLAIFVHKDMSLIMALRLKLLTGYPKIAKSVKSFIW